MGDKRQTCHGIVIALEAAGGKAMTAITLNSARNPITPLLKRAVRVACQSYSEDQQAQGKNLQPEPFIRHLNDQAHSSP